MGGKGSFIALLAIVAILALALAILTGYVFIIGGTSKTDNALSTGKVAIPDSSQLSRKPIFGDDPEIFNLKQEDDGTLGVLQLNAELVYFKKVKGVKNTDELIDENISEIKETITQYFLGKTYTEVSQEKGLREAKEDLKARINEIFKKKEAIVNNVVWDVVISKWNIQIQ